MARACRSCAACSRHATSMLACIVVLGANRTRLVFGVARILAVLLTELTFREARAGIVRMPFRSGMCRWPYVGTWTNWMSWRSSLCRCGELRLLMRMTPGASVRFPGIPRPGMWEQVELYCNFLSLQRRWDMLRGGSTMACRALEMQPASLCRHRGAHAITCGCTVASSEARYLGWKIAHCGEWICPECSWTSSFCRAPSGDWYSLIVGAGFGRVVRLAFGAAEPARLICC